MAYRFQQSPPRGARPGDVLVVVHDFDARSQDELTLRRGDRVELVELDDGFGDGWYLGKHVGREGNGLFPGVYTAVMGGPTPQLATISSPKSPITATPSNIHTQDAQPMKSPTQSPPIYASSPESPQEQTPQASRVTSMVESNQSQPLPLATSTNASQNEARRSNSVKTASASIPNIQRSINETMGSGAHNGEDSPVMNETLSVIDEHITDLSTPRHSAAPLERQLTSDSASEYSSHRDSRVSYLAGPETDDEEDGKLTEAQVKKWDHKQTAQYLRQIGVDPHHCDIFEEQEISGDVLLDMDQAFIYMKEYDFGVMGKRLKTWHKIRGVQEEARGSTGPRQSASNHSAYDGSTEDLDRSQSRLGQSSFLPRIPSLIDKSGAYRQSRQQTPPNLYQHPSLTNKTADSPASTQNTRASVVSSVTSPAAAWKSGPDSPVRPSAASIRELSHSRRHSSIDATHSPTVPSQPAPLSGRTTVSHQKQPSFDRNWSMTSAVPTLNNLSTPPLSSIEQTLSQDINASDPNLMTSTTVATDPDRGYFSGPEVDNRKTRNVLRKRESTGTAHSRHSSLVEDTKRSASGMKRHSRIGSADSIRDMVPLVTSPAAKAYHSNSYKGRFRSASSKTVPTGMGGISPTVTNLEDQEGVSPVPFIPSPKPDTANFPPSTTSTSTVKPRRVVGLRAISDAVTGHEKALVSPQPSLPSPIKEDDLASPTRTGSSTPSATSKSIDNDTTDASSKGTEPPFSVPRPQAPTRGKTKSKKETSAYIRGLQKVTPAQARADCDHSGWMKKKSSSLMTTWKARLFILKGRRLSYYYSEDDTEERGIIDISSHRVLVADQDTITTLHATITGSASSPVSPQSALNPAATDEKSVANRVKSGQDGPFFFKLVPPKAGLSRAVQFTKPTIHYFQVDTLNEGRKWMGEMLKNTIDHGVGMGFETTNKQKTISLAKARARKERPPALKGDDPAEPVLEGPRSDDTGLNIRGLSFDDGPEGGLQNGHGHVKQSSLEAIGAFMARTSSEKAQDSS